MESDRELLSLNELAKRLPQVRGKPINRSTIYRWATTGLKSKSGHIVRLETRFIGGTRCASVADVEDFGRAIDDIAWSPPKLSLNAKEKAAMRERGLAAAEELRRLGVFKPGVQIEEYA
jgi:hypothetical protein